MEIIFFLQNLQPCCAFIPKATSNIYLYTKLIWENWIIITILYMYNYLKIQFLLTKAPILQIIF